MRSIGVRELRQNASRWLRQVAGGESFEITDRGQPVAMLVPIRSKVRGRLIDAGVIQPAEEDGLDIEPLKQRANEQPLSTILEEARSTER